MHIPVLLKEVIDSLDPKPGETVIDCNINRAGHSIEMAKIMGDSGLLIGIDLDAIALEEARINLARLEKHPRILLLHDNFTNIDRCLSDAGIEYADKILYDLGLSSQELDSSGRGFTFQKNEPLQMTFQSNVLEETLTAKDILNLWSEETLADIIYHYGDERYAKRIARVIVESRKIKALEKTFDLVEAVRSAVPKNYQYGKTHFATKTFQAIRIAVNDEIGALEMSLEKSFNILKSGGRISAITFHSIEDRVIKNFSKNKVLEGKAKLLNKKPIVPTFEEVKNNSRSRSSKLRTIIKN